jgi:carbon storage regulator
MLVLARRPNESIVIAEQVRVTVLRITPNRVELGVDAASHISVDREEVHRRKQVAVMATRGRRTTQLSAAESRLKRK